MSIITLASSCVDEVPAPDVNVIPSKDIVFGSVMTDDIIITRSGEAGPRTVSEKVIASEVGDVSLPIVVEVEKGIHRPSAPATKATITHDKDDIDRLDAWAIYTKYTDETQTTFQKRSLYFKESDPDGAPLSFTKNDTDGIFYSDGTKYPWPGDATAMFNFVTVSPVNSGFQARLNALNNIVSFDYTVPVDPAQHKDILVASPEMIETDFRKPVPLTFKHVMAAVNVKVGEVPNGKITSVKFTGVYNKASYFPDGDGWVNRTIADGGEFSVDLPDGGVTVGTQSNGTTLTTGEAGFMMIPQQLFTGAELQVTFLPDGRTEPLVLRASIQGDIWEMNTTTNYWISINPDYMISIVPLDKTLDSHYIITKVEISSEFPMWTLQASASDGALVTVQPESEVNPMAKQGFWTDKIASKDANGNYYVAADAGSARGEDFCRGGQGAGQIVYVFIPENVSGETRTITLSIAGTGAGTGAGTDAGGTKTLTLTQEPVVWMDPTGAGETYWGCELLLEGGQVPWGFYFADLNEDWRAYGKVTNQPGGWWDKITEAMRAAGLNIDDLTSGEGAIQLINRNDHGTSYLLRIDYGEFVKIDVAEDYDDGEQNTRDLYYFDGLNALASIKDFLIASSQAGNKGLEHVPGTFDGDIEKTLDYAALYAMKRNRFHLYTEVINTDAGNITMQVPVIEEKDINWYLPAKDQFPVFMNTDWGQSFTFNDLFWTSTAYLSETDTDNAHSYAYLNGVETISHRNDKYLTFALRRYTVSSEVEIPINPDDVIKPGDDISGGGNGGTGGGNEGEDIEGGTGN